MEPFQHLEKQMNAGEKALSILNKIAIFERSKHLTDTQKAQLIDPLTQQLTELTGQGQLGLEGGAAPSQAPTKAAK